MISELSDKRGNKELIIDGDNFCIILFVMNLDDAQQIYPFDKSIFYKATKKNFFKFTYKSLFCYKAYKTFDFFKINSFIDFDNFRSCLF